MHFNTIIANPPYEFGNEITRAVIDNIDFDNYINLMPTSYYKTNNLYKHVVSSKALPIDAFKDAYTQAHVAVLSKEAREVSRDEFALLNYREDLQKFYRENLKRECTFTPAKSDDIKSTRGPEGIINGLKARGINPETSFMVPSRATSGGVSKKASYDREWNLEKSIALENLKIGPSKDLGPNGVATTYDFMNFKTPEEHKNFCDFWYRANLSTKLLKGLHTQGVAHPAIPRVDWSRPWTDEEILDNYGYTAEEIERILEN